MVEFVKDVHCDLVLSPYFKYPHIVREDGITCSKGTRLHRWNRMWTKQVCYQGDEGVQRESQQLV